MQLVALVLHVQDSSGIPVSIDDISGTQRSIDGLVLGRNLVGTRRVPHDGRGRTSASNGGREHIATVWFEVVRGRPTASSAECGMRHVR